MWNSIWSWYLLQKCEEYQNFKSTKHANKVKDDKDHHYVFDPLINVMEMKVQRLSPAFFLAQF